MVAALMSGRGSGRLSKNWRGLRVDADLTDALLERMNSIPGVMVHGTCAGHPEREGGERTAWINFTVPDMKGADYGDTDEEVRAYERHARRTFGDVAGVEIIGTSAEEHKLVVSLSSRTPRERLTDREAGAWWTAVVDRMERFAETGPSLSGRMMLGVREKKLKIYTFKELPPKAKKRAVEDFRDDPELTWDQSDSEQLTETFEQDLDDHYGLGDGMEANWSLSYSQGDGVCFKGPVDVGKFITTEKLEGKFGPLVDRIGVRIRHDGRYCHWNSMDVEVENHAREEDVARKEDLGLIGNWEDERDEIMERWRADYAKAREESLAPVRDWEERKARREAEWKHFEARRGRGPKAWLPGAPAPFNEPKPAPLPIPLPKEPVIVGPPDVEAARARVENAWKEFEELVAEFTAHLEDRIKEISREMEKSGYEEMDYHRSDEYITERLENADWEYLEDGRRYRD